MTGIPDVWRRHFEAAKVIIDDLGLVLPLGAAEYPIQLGEAELSAGEPIRTVDLLMPELYNPRSSWRTQQTGDRWRR